VPPAGKQVARMRNVCAGGEVALLGPARAAYAVTFKSGQQARVVSDREWQKVLWRVHIKGTRSCCGDAIGVAHWIFLSGWVGVIYGYETNRRLRPIHTGSAQPAR
jgi:hypothetical protein